MKNINPLVGKVGFNREGKLWMEKGIKFGEQLNPKLTVREWFFLALEAAKKDIEKNKIDATKLKKAWLGSPVTQWRSKTSLIKKGYLTE